MQDMSCVTYRYYRIMDAADRGFVIFDPAGLWCDAMPPWATKKELEKAIDRLIANYN